MTTLGSVEQLVKRYGRQVALDGVTMQVSSNEIVGLIGPNGAGKTTLLRVFARLLGPTSGQVRIDPSASVRYFAGERTLPPWVTARQWLSLWPAAQRASAARRLGVLSRGTRQQLGLRAVLAGSDATVLLLDEPWEGLDPDASRWLSESLLKKRADGVGAIVSSHRLHDLAGVCDRYVFLMDGRLSGEQTDAHAASADVDRVAALFAAFDRTKAGS